MQVTDTDVHNARFKIVKKISFANVLRGMHLTHLFEQKARKTKCKHNLCLFTREHHWVLSKVTKTFNIFALWLIQPSKHQSFCIWLRQISF